MVKQWWDEPEDVLREMVKDADLRTVLQGRLEELKAVNQHGVRCVMSKDMEEKLARVLG